MRYDNLTESQMKKVIRGQKKLINKNGYEPTWDLFKMTFGWFQISKEMSSDTQKKYQQIWEEDV